VLVVALGTIGMIALRQMADADNQEQSQERLEESVAAQLQNLRDHLFRR
jgi:hypothetical protein